MGPPADVEFSTMNLTKYLLAALLALALAACGSSDPKDLIKEGNTALGSNDSATALAKFDEALKSLKEGDALYLDARLGKIEALIAGEPKKAAAEFLELSAKFPDKVGNKEFIYMGGKMVSAHQYLDAIDLVHNGIKRAGGEAPALMVMIDRIKKEAASDKAVSDKLKGLGYTN